MYSQIKEARRVRDWRPLPPIPISNMLPLGCRITRTILETEKEEKFLSIVVVVDAVVVVDDDGDSWL